MTRREARARVTHTGLVADEEEQSGQARTAEGRTHRKAAAAAQHWPALIPGHRSLVLLDTIFRYNPDLCEIPPFLNVGNLFKFFFFFKGGLNYVYGTDSADCHFAVSELTKRRSQRIRTETKKEL